MKLNLLESLFIASCLPDCINNPDFDFIMVNVSLYFNSSYVVLFYS